MKASSLATFLALSGVALLPACSMFGGSDRNGAGRPASTAGTTSPSYAATSNYSSNQQLATSEMTPDMIRKVQQNLKDAGAYKARVDGVWGPQTGAAVRDYQQQHNINATGQLDQQTLDAMNLGTSNTNQSNATGDQNGRPQQSANYNPPPNTNNGQANYNPPPPSNTNDQTNSDANGSNTSTKH